ncbi:MAG: hypothetical protein H7Z10_01250 [Gemmatimonadaceae bacterium]|nr:hypothetical protein [Acetobacteraceae bacterium]
MNTKPAALDRIDLWGLVTFFLVAVVGLGRRAGDLHAATIDLDESVYIVIARRWLEGDLPYVAVYDVHPVGLPALLAAATWLLGDGLVAARVTATLAVAATCGMLCMAGARFTRSFTAGAVAALLYAIFMLRPEALVPNTEHYNNLLVTSAAYLLFGQAERIAAGRPLQYLRALAAALLLGAGLQVKYVVAPEAIGFCLAFLAMWLLHGAALRNVLASAGGLMVAGLMPTLIVVGYFWHNGALEPFLDANIRSTISYATTVPPMDQIRQEILMGSKQLLFLGIGAVSILVVLATPQAITGVSRRLVLACLLWLVLSTVNVTLPMKFFGHYFYALLPPLCLLAAVAVTMLGRLRGRLTPLVQVAVVLVLAAPPLRAIARDVIDPVQKLPRSTELAAACVRSTPARSPGLYVFNWDPVLYELTRIAPPTRFVLPAEIAEWGESAGVDTITEVTRILAGNPGHIVVASQPMVRFSADALRLMDQALVRYDAVCSVPYRIKGGVTLPVTVYRLR